MSKETRNVEHRGHVIASEDGIYRICATKVGAKAVFNRGPNSGKGYVWSEEGIKALEGTGEGGRISRNHETLPNVEEYGIIGPAEVEDGRVYLNVRVPPWLDEELTLAKQDVQEGELFFPVSIECDVTAFNDEEQSLDGGVITGISFTMGDHRSHCSLAEGCGVTASGEAEAESEDPLPSNVSEEDVNTMSEFEIKYNMLKEEYDAFKVSVEASTAELKEGLEAELEDVKSQFSAYRDETEPLIAQMRAAKLEEITEALGEEKAAMYAGEGVPLSKLDEVLDIIGSRDKVAASEPVKNSGASIEASQGPGADEMAGLKGTIDWSKVGGILPRGE